MGTGAGTSPPATTGRPGGAAAGGRPPGTGPGCCCCRRMQAPKGRHKHARWVFGSVPMTVMMMMMLTSIEKIGNLQKGCHGWLVSLPQVSALMIATLKPVAEVCMLTVRADSAYANALRITLRWRHRGANITESSPQQAAASRSDHQTAGQGMIWCLYFVSLNQALPATAESTVQPARECQPFLCSLLCRLLAHSSHEYTILAPVVRRQPSFNS